MARRERPQAHVRGRWSGEAGRSDAAFRREELQQRRWRGCIGLRKRFRDTGRGAGGEGRGSRSNEKKGYRLLASLRSRRSWSRQRGMCAGCRMKPRKQAVEAGRVVADARVVDA